MKLLCISSNDRILLASDMDGGGPPTARTPTGSARRAHPDTVPAIAEYDRVDSRVLIQDVHSGRRIVIAQHPRGGSTETAPSWNSRPVRLEHKAPDSLRSSDFTHERTVVVAEGWG